MHLDGAKKAQTTKVKVLLAILSLAVYTLIFQSVFVGFLILLGLLVHEKGHLRAAEFMGIATKGMYFLPGIGAVALIEEMPKSRSQECFIAIAGPFYGMGYTCLLAALSGLVPWVGVATILGTAACWSGFINLLNLLCPIDPLDGGRILKSITFSLHPILGFTMLISAVVLAAFLAFKGLFIFYLVAFAAVGSIFEEKKIYKTRSTMRWFDAIYASIGVTVIAFILAWASVVGAAKDPSVKEKLSEQAIEAKQEVFDESKISK